MDIVFDCIILAWYVKQVVNNVTLPLGYQPRMNKIKRIKSKSKHGVVMSQQKQNENFWELKEDIAKNFSTWVKNEWRVQNS